MTASPSLFRLARADGPDILPLAPFLESLKSDGIRTTLHDYERIHLALRGDGPWTLARLRSTLAALLVQDAEQERLLRRRFDQFFGLGEEEQAAFSDVDAGRVLEDLRALERSAETPPSRRSVPRRATFRATRRTRNRSRVALWLLEAAILVASAWGAWKLRPLEVTSPPPPPIEIPPGTEGSSAETPEVVRQYVVPVVTAVYELQAVPTRQATEFEAWRVPALFAITLFQILCGFWLWERQRPPDDVAPEWDDDAPRLFRATSIGGKPAPRLDRGTLDLFADALGYFRTEEPSRRLDVRRSVEATGESGGVPRLVFERRKRVKSVVALEDVLAEPRDWNPIAGELVRGLERRGVPVLHGFFHGVPDRFRTAQGMSLDLEDLEDDRRGYLLLLFSDGKGLYHRRDAFVLEGLRRWPLVAWMELRERRAWDESTALVADHGLPVYPASCDGMLRVLGRFATERASQEDFSKDRTFWRGRPTGLASRLLEHDLERLLGDALPWAEACAMMPPPIGFGFADKIRRTFYKELPPERVERLLALPGIAVAGGGIGFSRRLLALLRNSFLIRNDEDRQEEILEFLLAEVTGAEVGDEKSLEHHAWEWKLERLRLELEPDRALKRLSELAKGPLAEVVRGDLAKSKLASRIEERDVEVPLRKKPKTRRSLQRLLALAKESGVQRREAYSTQGWQWVLLSLLTVSWIIAGTGVVEFGKAGPQKVPLLWYLVADDWNLAADDLVGTIQVDVHRDGQWSNVESADLRRPKKEGDNSQRSSVGITAQVERLQNPLLEIGQKHRVRLGSKPAEGFEVIRWLGEIRQSLLLEIGKERREILKEPVMGMTMHRVAAGSFQMGSPEDEPGRGEGETLHKVELIQDFWISETEVTQGQWEALMKNNPARFRNCGKDCPVEQVNWFEAVTFANRFSERSGLPTCYAVTGCRGVLGGGCDTNEPFCSGDYRCDEVELVNLDCRGYRLPTEAEWEYAARAGTETALYNGTLTTVGDANGPELDEIAWYAGNSGVSYEGGYDCSGWPEKQYPDQKNCGSQPVGKKLPNGWALHDMIGNVWEWTWDRYGEYRGTDVDPRSAEGGSDRVVRGGSWSSYARNCRAAFRNRYDPGIRFDFVGFRLLRTSD